jgi:hypothetical protein
MRRTVIVICFVSNGDMIHLFCLCEQGLEAAKRINSLPK